MLCCELLLIMIALKKIFFLRVCKWSFFKEWLSCDFMVSISTYKINIFLMEEKLLLFTICRISQFYLIKKIKLWENYKKSLNFHFNQIDTNLSYYNLKLWSNINKFLEFSLAVLNIIIKWVHIVIFLLPIIDIHS